MNIRVIAFARMIGRSLTRIPYANHKNTPVVNTKYIPIDKSFACLVFIIFINCGKNEMVVQVAATNPSMVVKFIIINLYSGNL